ncbi:MAG: phosphodiester glycosidase family protein [Chloroflexi bacterium]|nr:phosphodiester glycosidase family protein [Chloroflexota bacterium]
MAVNHRLAVKYRLSSLILVAALLAGCGEPIFATPSVEFMTQIAPTMAAPVTRAPTATPVPLDTGWRTIAPGIEYRELRIEIGAQADRLRIARVEPAQTRVRVLYAPDSPRRVSEWLISSQVQLAINGNYFDPQNRALGLIIADGGRTGVNYDGFGGMLAISENTVKVRWNVGEPYRQAEALTYAIQNFPMLVLPGGQANLQIDDNERLAPRSVVAQDRSGRIVFLVSPSLMFTLTGLGQWLAASDLDIDVALNLDGGTSSGLMLREGNQTVGVDSWVNVPSVIVVDSR